MLMLGFLRLYTFLSWSNKFQSKNYLENEGVFIKKVFVLFLFMSFIASQAKADIIHPKVTNVAQASENIADFGFFPLGNNLTVEVVAWEYLTEGIAYQFNLAHDTVINSILSPIAVPRFIANDGTFIPGTQNLTLVLYSGSTNESRGQILPNGMVIPRTR